MTILEITFYTLLIFNISYVLTSSSVLRKKIDMKIKKKKYYAKERKIEKSYKIFKIILL